MEKPKPIQVQDFLLFITSQNTILTLEAEHEATEKIFTINLDSDSIGQVTNGLFDSVEKMVQGLKDATDENFKDLTLTISPQGKLTYLAVLVSGVIKKEFSFTLNLTEKEMEPIEIFSRRLNSVKGELDKWKAVQEMKVQAQDTQIETIQAFQARSEEMFNRLENMMMKMEQKTAQRLDTLEKLCENFKLSIPLKPDVYFNPNSVNASNYVLSDNNRTVKLGSGSYTCLELLPQIPSTGRYSFSLMINTETRGIVFGITTETTKANWNTPDNLNYRYWTNDGTIYGRLTKGPDRKSPFGGNNKIIKMIVDMDQGTLTFFVDNQQISFCNISKSDKYFAYMSLGNVGDSVTLI